MISIFLSYPKPHLAKQQEFIDLLCDYLKSRDFCPRTLGVTDYDMDEPLIAIRRLMLESNGLLTVAFRRSYITNGTGKLNSDIPGIAAYDISGSWLTSPYCHIEPAMAFQLGLPILIFRENGVLDDGILQHGVTGTYLPVFDLDKQPIKDYFASPEWTQLINKWESLVRKVSDNKVRPPILY